MGLIKFNTTLLRRECVCRKQRRRGGEGELLFGVRRERKANNLTVQYLGIFVLRQLRPNCKRREPWWGGGGGIPTTYIALQLSQEQHSEARNKSRETTSDKIIIIHTTHWEAILSADSYWQLKERNLSRFPPPPPHPSPLTPSRGHGAADQRGGT